ncbi:NUDIX domain-containing protein [Halomicroarcula limicola]|uniref:NUDIX domain-containing protein n=1 Tax=Haloarcula limicola TaxID=1429915 RepID=A0A8J8C2K9_9EURY|nr:NUDIX domain-containing protein [Halomicroarcula limicola]MBV0923202.1 NUDIX domain-containing protein [Halomicroarcula limicola]
MTTAPTDYPSVPDHLTDPEPLRGDVPFHEESDVVDEAVLDRLDELDDMAPVGVTNDDREVLVMRVTDDCRWKIPSSAVAPGEDYAEAARQWVENNVGLDVELDGVVGVWRYEAQSAGGDRTATRNFVVFGASPANEDGGGKLPADGVDAADAAAEVGWFTELPDGAEAVPGTDLFFE